MPSVIKKVLKKKNAVYWPRIGFNSDGSNKYGDPVELDARWDDETEEVFSTDGNRTISNTQVMLSDDVEVGGLLVQSSLEAIENPSRPLSHSPAPREIIKFTKNPNFKQTEFLRIAYL